MICSVENLPKEQRECFKMLAMFDHDVDIPVKALETIWDLDEFDSEEYMKGYLTSLAKCYWGA